MKTILYSYAYDAEKKIVNVAKAEKGKNYFCIGCGCEMVLKAGAQKQRHFAHVADSVCSGETYLHEIAKLLIAKYIRENKDLSARYAMMYECSADCPMHTAKKCQWKALNTFEIAKYYRTDEIKIETYYQGFKPDILLRDNKDGKNPIFIEIAVTHECEEEKIQSGIRIIEIKIKDEKDLIDFCSKKVIEETDNNEWGKKLDGCDIKFYNFKNCKRANTEEIKQRMLNYCGINTNYKGYYCGMQCLSPKPKDKYGILSYSGLPNYHVKDVFLLAINDGVWIKNCYTCRYSALDDDCHLLCKLYKKHPTMPRNPKPSVGHECKAHRFIEKGNEDYQELLRRLQSYSAVVLKDGERWDYSL